MPVFTQASPEVVALADQVMNEFHPDLVRAEMTLQILMAHPKNLLDGLKLRGYPVAAVARKVPYKSRVNGEADAEITIDARGWEKLSERQRVALLDHELYHFVALFDDEGHTKTDDADRPKLKMRLHDLEIGTFDVISERHGRHALDTEALAVAVAKYRQLGFEWADDEAGKTSREAELEAGSVTLSYRGKSVTMTNREFKEAPEKIRKMHQKQRPAAVGDEDSDA